MGVGAGSGKNLHLGGRTWHSIFLSLGEDKAFDWRAADTYWGSQSYVAPVLVSP